jgi:serine/threonine-protein kinase
MLEILLVDDEPSIRLSVADALGKLGHRVTTAADGAEAMSLVSSSVFDVVVLDIRLPNVQDHVRRWSEVRAVVSPEKDPARSLGRFGRYLVLARWGGGGMADVYLARQRGAEGFDKLVALKLLRSELAEEPEFREMFYSEARIAALLSHPAIVQTFDVGEIDGSVYMAMEFVNGEPLGRLIRAVRSEGGLPPPLAAEIAREVATALHHAHTVHDLEGRPLEFVHRDVSPSNIMLTHEGATKLLDFGIAKVATKALATRVGVIKGKAAYMSPEQMIGEKVDARSDVYSLGVVLWEMLVGRRAFHASNDISLMAAVAAGQIQAPSAAGAVIDEEMDEIVMRAITRSPAGRWESAESFAEALAAWQAVCAPGFSAGTAVRDLMTRHFSERAEKLRTLVSNSSRVDSGQYAALEMSPSQWEVPSLTPPSIESMGGQSPISILSGAIALAAAPTLAKPPAAKTAWPRVLLGIGGAALVLLIGAALLTWPAPEGEIQVTSEPPGAEVLIDGRVMGEAPLVAKVPSGRDFHVTVQQRATASAVGCLGG